MSAPDPSIATTALLGPLLAGDLAEYCLRVSGPGRVRLVGSALVAMAAPLRAAGCEVVDTQAEVANDATLLIAWAENAEERASVLDQNASVLVLVGAEEAGTEVTAWAAQAAVSGWQHHPAVFTLADAPEGVVALVLTRDGVSVANADAGVLLRASYHGLAAALVRPGDAVLAIDAAQHGLWRIVQQQSRCRWLGVLTEHPRQPLLAQGLEWLAPETWRQCARYVDVVIARLSRDRTDWAKQLQEAHAALVRSGRMVLMVPLEARRGALHRELVASIEQHGMVIDRAWWQNLTGRPGPGQFVEVARDPAGRVAITPGCIDTADALVFMAVKIDGPGFEQDPSLRAPNIIAFQRDYLDASVVRLIVSVGLRLESAGLRRQLARKVMDEAPPSSADHGAALCVLLYDPAALEGDCRAELLAAARRYIDAPATNPTVLRWQVSLAFAAAALYQADGDLPEAAELYNRVLSFDVLAYSPLLGTKTTVAALRLGWIQFGRGNIAAARQAWSMGLDEARRLSEQSSWSEVVGDPEAPETFAMPEFAAVMDEAGCLASALRVTAEVPLRPGMAWQWSNRSWRSQLQAARTDQQRRQMRQKELQDTKDWLDGQYRQLTAELENRSEVIQALESDKRGWDVRQKQLQEAKDWLDEQYHHLTAELESRSEVIQALESDKRGWDVRQKQLQDAKDWSDEQYHHLTAELESRSEVIQSLESEKHSWEVQQEQLQDAKDWLEEQYRHLTAELENRSEVIQALESEKHAWEVRQEQLQDAKDWLDEQYRHLTAELENRSEVIHALEAGKRAMETEIAGERATFRLADARAVAERSALRQQLQEVQADYAQLSALHKQLDIAARNLATAVGVIMGDVPETQLLAESTVEKISRHAAALDRVPLKTMARTMLRLLISLLGRR